MNKQMEQYVGQFPDDVIEILTKIRSTILKVAPNAEEGISYGMPTYKPVFDVKILFQNAY